MFTFTQEYNACCVQRWSTIDIQQSKELEHPDRFDFMDRSVQKAFGVDESNRI